jgi:hypothetical protein
LLLDDWLDEVETAAAIGVSVRTLRQWRRKGEGPPYARFGRAIKYHKPALAEHFKSIQVLPVRTRKQRAAALHRNDEEKRT